MDLEMWATVLLVACMIVWQAGPVLLRQRYAVRAVGTVIGHVDLPSDTYAQTVRQSRVRFTDSDGDVQEFVSGERSAPYLRKDESFSVGARVAVAYYPDKPWTARIVGPA